jgi:peptide/nickel transport system ATP-binding protein
MLQVSGLQVDIRRGDETRRVVNDVDLNVAEHEIVGIVGESGAGKSMMARALVKLLPLAARIPAGQVEFDGRDLLTCTNDELRAVRGQQIGVILQDPMSSLDPTMTIGKQVSEPLIVHGEKNRRHAMATAAATMQLVGLPDATELLSAYPHQLSGGMRQRVAIAMSLICGPRFLIADEPTTALDVTIQAQILEVLRELRSRLGLSILLISHDIGVVSSIADRIVVMYGGEVVEEGPAEDVLANPGHRYTESLLAALSGPTRHAAESRGETGTESDGTAGASSRCCFVLECPTARADCWAGRPAWHKRGPSHRAACLHPPPPAREREVPSVPRVVAVQDRWHVRKTVEDHEVLRAESLSKSFPILQGMMRKRIGTRYAVSDVSFVLNEGENLAVIGESGCGKTTLARMLVGLEQPTNGRVLIHGVEQRSLRKSEARRSRRQIQLMFQDPYASLDPRMKVLRSVREPLTVQGVGSKEERNARVYQLLDSVGLSAEAAGLFPHEFSGGQRQRLAFARAIILNPDIVVADEPVSALDVSVRAQVLGVMTKLQAENPLSYIVISHDISIVRQVADRTAVMYAGRLVEIGPTRSVLTSPRHPYTQGLLASVPSVSEGSTRASLSVGIRGELAHHPDLHAGCPFRFRCPARQAKCETIMPDLEAHGASEGEVACHFPLASGAVREEAL